MTARNTAWNRRPWVVAIGVWIASPLASQDPLPGTISISVGGVELGAQGGDGIPVRFALGLGQLRFASQPVLSGRKGSLKY